MHCHRLNVRNSTKCLVSLLSLFYFSSVFTFLTDETGDLRTCRSPILVAQGVGVLNSDSVNVFCVLCAGCGPGRAGSGPTVHCLCSDRCSVLSGCEEGRFGADCSSACSGNSGDGRCKDHLLCVPEPYGCGCAPGYSGTHCNTRKLSTVRTQTGNG